MQALFNDIYAFTSEVAAFKHERALLVWKWEGEDALSRGYCFRIDLAQPIEKTDSCMHLLGERATLSNTAQGVRWHGIITQLQQMGEDAQYRYLRVTLEPQWSIARLDHTSRIHASENPDIRLSHLVNFTLSRCGLQPPGAAGNGTSDDYQWLVNKEHEDRFVTDFVCQYDETSYAFLSRQLEHAGVSYEFEHGTHHEKMVFRSEKEQTATDRIKLMWRPDAEHKLSASGDMVNTLTRSARMAPETIGLLDHDPAHAAVSLASQADILRERYLSRSSLKGRRVIYGERYTQTNDGDYIAEMRAKQVHSERHRLTGKGCSPRLRAGNVVELVGFPKSRMSAESPVALAEERDPSGNVTLRVIQVRHTGQQPLPGKVSEENESAYIETEWTATPASVPFYPALDTPVPRIPGLVTAVIESAAGNYPPRQTAALTHPDADPDAHPTPDTTKPTERDYPYLNRNGYYRVRFHFAENEQDWQHPVLSEQDELGSKENFPDLESAAPRVARNSGWVRMATPYAGASGSHNGEFGMYFPLTEGAEVLVSFLNGDPDRPVIIGAVPNSDNPSMVYGNADPSPAGQTDESGDEPLDATRLPSRIAGVVTQGGNMLAFNTESGKQLAALASPTANSYVALGGDINDTKAPGIVLHSEREILTKAKSKVEDIEGKGLRRIYDLTPEAPESGTTKERTAEFYKTGKKFTALLATGEAGINLSKPKLSANIDMTFGASAKLSLDMALKFGASFTGVIAADWSVGFAVKTDVNFLEHNRTKKSESFKTRKRSAVIIEDELKAGKRMEKLIRKEVITGSTKVFADTVYRNEAAKAIVLSVWLPPPAPRLNPDDPIPANRATQAPNSASLLAAVQPTSLAASLIPKFSSSFEAADAIPDLSRLPQDEGNLSGASLSSLRLTTTHAELSGDKHVEISLKKKQGSVTIDAGGDGTMTLKRGATSVVFDNTGLKANSTTAGVVHAKTELTLEAGSNLYLKSSATAAVNSTGLLTLQAGNVVKLG